MTHHTPGPWSAEGPDCYGDFNVVPAHEALAIGAIVRNGMRPDEETAANARLAAAAPEMRDILERIFHSYPSYIPDFCEAIVRVLKKIDATPSRQPPMAGLVDAIAERVRQIEAEGWTAEHDDSHAEGEMARAAAAYCLGQYEMTGRVQDGKRFLLWRSVLWPWSKEWWKPKTRREDLIRAAALIVAEIERLDRNDGGDKP